MKQILLLVIMTAVVTTLQAQKKKKAVPGTSGFAITAVEKGGRSWKEVRQIDAATGDVLRVIYDSKQETEALNARTGKPIVKKDGPAKVSANTGKVYSVTATAPPVQKRVVNLDNELNKVYGHPVKTYTRTVVVRQHQAVDKPFATNSAAMAYDKKHERLYYTPMGISQLRYIDLKSGKIYYFEDEPFGVVQHFGDSRNQITRMVIASDGNGYALTNDANHLIRFTTGKNPTITDLGPVADADAAKYSIHSPNGYGGDMVADASDNLYLLTANRNVFKINIETRAATHLGVITGLPKGFSTNGAMVEEGSKVIVASSESIAGYYRFDLNNLQAEKMSGSPDVFNASDLANGVLAFDKKKKKDKPEEEAKTEIPPAAEATTAKADAKDDVIIKNGIAVFPNPVINGIVNLSFDEQPAGRYQVQLLDMSGRLISAKEVNISSSAQIEKINMPELSVKGNYLLRVTSEVNKVNVTNKIVVQ